MLKEIYLTNKKSKSIVNNYFNNLKKKIFKLIIQNNQTFLKKKNKVDLFIAHNNFKKI
jgi:hypothetical protein